MNEQEKQVQLEQRQAELQKQLQREQKFFTRKRCKIEVKESAIREAAVKIQEKKQSVTKEREIGS